MNNWKDITIHGRRDTNKVPNVWEWKKGKIRITVIRHHRHYEGYVINCFCLGMINRSLSMTSQTPVHEAQEKAIEVVKERINYIHNIINEK